MPLRTYPLIAHPAFLAFVEHQKGRDHGLYEVKPVETPTHRPEIGNVTDIADYLQISHYFLRSILRRPWKHYRTFYFTKRSGGLREINSPRTFLKVIQWWILDTILYNSEISSVAHGFVPYKSFVTNAQEHLGARHVLNVDVEDFFPSLRLPVVAAVFGSLGYSEEVSGCLAELTTFNGHLPQGAPSSPALANLALRHVDEAINDYARTAGLRYTRYADDMTLSSNERIDAGVLDFISLHLSTVGLRLNARKTRFMGPNCTKEITGLILGRDGIRLPRQTLNAARGWFHKVSIQPSEYQDQLERVRGTLSLIRQVGGAGSSTVILLGRMQFKRLTTRFLDFPQVDSYEHYYSRWTSYRCPSHCSRWKRIFLHMQ